MPDLSFWQQVGLSAIDKLFLGAVVGFAGLLGKQILERYKAMQALYEEIARKRMDKLIPIWEELDQLRRESTDAYLKASATLIGRVPFPPDKVQSALQPFDVIEKKLSAIQENILNSSFLVGPQLKKLHNEYIWSLLALLQIQRQIVSKLGLAERDQSLLDKLDETKKKVDDLTQSHLYVEAIVRLV